VITLEERDVRRPATVVGRLPRTGFTTEEVWLHPTRDIAYLGTGSGGDRMFTIDISNPAKPVVTDSIVENTRRVNDIMTTPDGRFVSYTSDESGRREVYVSPFPEPRDKWQVSSAGGRLPMWRRDGSELYYLAPDNKLMGAAIQVRGAQVEVGTVRPLFATAARRHPPAATGQARRATLHRRQRQ